MKMSARLAPFFCRVVTVVQEQLECLLLVSFTEELELRRVEFK